MISPGNEFPAVIQPALEKMKSGWTIMIVVKIVLTRPKQLDGNAHDFRNRCRFQHVVVRQAPPESAARPLHVYDDVSRRNAEHFRNKLTSRLWCLTGRPEFQLPVMKVGQTIFRLHRRVSQEW